MVKVMAFHGANKNIMIYWIIHLWFDRNTSEVKRNYQSATKSLEFL